MKRLSICGLLALSLMLASGPSQAASVKISIGIRETNSAGTIFDNGTSTGGIEFVNRDGQTLTADGTWQLFSFTPASDTLTAFAGATANSVLEAGHEWAALEMIRVLNDEGITAPLRIWIDDVTNTIASGPVVQNFDSSTLGSEVMFQEPGFSGSTAAFIAPGSTTAVNNSMAFSGSQSLELDLQFVNATTTNWARVTTFNTPNQPNPRVRVREPGGPNPTISFYAKLAVVPEPASLALVGLAGIGLACLRSRK
jgi:hypothetical protein